MKDFGVVYLRGGISLQAYEKAYQYYKMFSLKISATLLAKLVGEGHNLDSLVEQLAPQVSEYFITETCIGDTNVIVEILNELVLSIE